MVEETRSSNRTLILLAVGALLLALVVAVVVLVVVIGRDGDSGQGAAADSAKLIPADALMFFSMAPDFTAADNFDVIRQAWGDIPDFAKVVDNWPAVLFEEVEELDFNTDIGPWLGDEVSFSMGADFFTSLGDSVDSTFEKIPILEATNPADMRMGAVQFAVPEFTVPTFEADNNKIQWYIKVHGDIHRWPDIDEEYEVTVLPLPVAGN